MKKIVSIKIVMLVIAVLCVLQITAISMGSCTPVVAVNPTDKSVSTGDVFSINITVDPQGCDIYGAQYSLNFDPAILQVVEQMKGEFLTQDGASTIEITNSCNNTIGKLEYGATRVSAAEGVRGNGTLASITFEVVANTGRTNLTLSNVVLSDPYSKRFEGIGMNNGVVRIVTPTDTCVRIEPAHSVVSAGDVFIVNVSVDPAGEELSGVQYDLAFDPAILEVIEQTKGEFLTQDGASSIEVTNRYNNTVGKLEYGEARIGTMEGVRGKGTLASITFEVVATSGRTDLTLSKVVLSDPYAQRLEGFGVYNGVVTIGTHINTSVSVEPAHRVVSAGDVFVINISVDPAGEAVYGAQYDLAFDPAILQVVEQTKGEFLAQDGAGTIEITNSYNNSIGKLEYGETRVGSQEGVTGKGTLASITFEVVADTGGTDLTLSNVVLCDTDVMSIDTVIYSGRVDIAEIPSYNVVITIPDIASVGTTSAPVSIKNGTNIGSCDLTLVFDPSVVLVHNVSGGDFDSLLSNQEIVYISNTTTNTTTGLVRIGAFQENNPGLSDGIVVANVTFIPVGNIGSSTKLSIRVTTLKDASPACNPIPYTVENGSFTVFLNGDVNGDGVVDIADCMYLAKHLLGTPGFEQIIAVAADVNGDRVIDIADCMYLAKYILGITGFEVLK